jgi:hypothetical protein
LTASDGEGEGVEPSTSWSSLLKVSKQTRCLIRGTIFALILPVARGLLLK